MIDQLTTMVNTVHSKQFSKYLSSRPVLKQWIVDQTRQYLPKNINESIYILIKSPPPLCSNGRYPLFNSYEKGYRVGCGNGCICAKQSQSTKLKEWHDKCAIEDRARMNQTAKNTWKDRYGVENPMHYPNSVQKQKNTNLERYGSEYAVSSKEVADRIKQTNLDRYGVEFPFESAEIQQKSQNTSMERYGSLMSHAKSASYAKYNGNNPFSVEEVKNQSKQTMIEKYGVEHALQNDQLKQKNDLNRY